MFSGLQHIWSRARLPAFIAAGFFAAHLGAQDVWVDDDQDGMHDLWETTHGLDISVNDAGNDPDNDGLTNLEEQGAQTGPQLWDTDFGGKSDGEELPSITQPEAFAQGGLVDGDPLNPADDANAPGEGQPAPPGAPAQPEQPQNGAPPDPGAGNGDPLGPAPGDKLGVFDHDGISDIDEQTETFTDPFDSDTDGDGIPDGREDTDGDDASDGAETRNNTDPFELDSDYDGFDDGEEIGAESDPLNPFDVPLDPQNPVGGSGPNPDEQPQTMPEPEQPQSGEETPLETTGGSGGEGEGASPTTIIGWVFTGLSFFDPTPISDLVDASSSFVDGDCWGAGLSLVAAAIPFVNSAELKVAKKVGDEIADALGGTGKAADDVAEAGARQADPPPGSDGPPSQSASGSPEVPDKSGVPVGSGGDEVPMEVGGGGGGVPLGGGSGGGGPVGGGSGGGGGSPPPTGGSTPPGGSGGEVPKPKMTSWGWKGSKPWKNAVDEVSKGGTIETIGGKTATKDEAIDLVEESGGTIERIEGGHLPPNPHTYPHINYTTESGAKGTIRIDSL